MKLFQVILVLTTGLFLACAVGEGIDIPTDPLAKYAPPHADATLVISPNPSPIGEVTQFWTITETDSVGFTVESVILESFDPGGSRTDSTAMNQQEIIDITGDNSAYFLPRFSFTGTRTTIITLTSQSWILVTVHAADDNNIPFSFSEKITIQ